ncbi:hypothetical protein JTE90_022063 [Oedothorax gibbosus]|uniref:Uncharacterized protein n=1 Tax=Oedothorax gibbosus TaxID=931172 RepID=A0AAV6TXT0_9ARAC|nr:hypothetical protein JTE90_022063 [Oedothorax gibbosus]
MHELTTKRKFREKCYCSDCSQVPGESKLTKILDASKAVGVIQETEWALELSSILPRKYLSPTLTRGYLKNLLKKQNEALGRTHLRRMQLLPILYSPEYPEFPKKEMRVGYVELTESMKEVWGDYHPELLTYYRCLVNLNRELGNEKEARQYCFKLWRLESVIYGAFFIDDRWEGALSEDQFRYFMEKSSQE